MKLKEMMKKIEAYNEIAKIMGNDKAGLKPDDGFCEQTFQSWDALKRFINKTYVKPAVKELFQYDGFEFNTRATIHWVDDWHDDVFDITPSIYTVW